MAFQPVGSGATVAIAANAAVGYSAKFAHKSDTIRVVTENASCHVAVGNTAVAATTDFVVGKDSTATLNVGRPSSQRVVGIETSGTTVTLYFPEGTGCPFFQGQKVSLTTDSAANKHWEFSDLAIASINQSADGNWGAGTKVTVTHDYGIGAGATAFTGINYSELRSNLLVSVKGTATQPYGALYYQQVQVSGDA